MMVTVTAQGPVLQYPKEAVVLQTDSTSSVPANRNDAESASVLLFHAHGMMLSGAGVKNDTGSSP